jgi:hypothetical protein
MTADEYKFKLEVLEKEYRRQKLILARDYAMSNNPVKVDDVIEDHMGKIRVTDIKPSQGYSGHLPECVYDGLILTRTGEVTKKKPNMRQVWQGNIINKQQ